MARQIGVKYGRQYLIKAVQYAGMGKESPESGVLVLHQRLHAFALAAGFF